MNASIPDQPRPDHARFTAYLLVALAALLAGFLLGMACRQGPGSSRADWPPPNPRALSP
jgi:hypothetical protein